MKKIWQSALDGIKKADADEDQMFALTDFSRDTILQNFVASWPRIKIKHKTKPPKQTEPVWDWLWDCIEIIDYGTWDEISWRLLFAQAKQDHLIYPDGTINQWAQKWLNAQVEKVIKKSKKSKKN